MSLVAAFIAVMTILYPLAMFRGLEPYSGYFGNVYHALHPDSFPNDPFMSPGRHTTQSLLYVVVKMTGGFWLDDRATLLLFMGMTAVTLIGIDKTVRVLGAQRAGERVAMLSMMLLGHQLLASHAFVVDMLDFSPTVFAGPLIVWLLYGALSGSRPRQVIPLMLVIPLISLKSAAMPLLIALALFWKDRLGARGRRVAVLAALGLAVGSLVVYYAVMRPPGDSHPWVFDHLIQEDPGEANPFAERAWISTLFLAMCLAGFFVKGLDAVVLGRVRIVAGLGLLVWLVGGLYASYAPNALKIPHLLAFHAPRMLWWTQYVLYLAFGVSLLKWLQRTPSWVGIAAAWGVLMALYLFHNTFHAKLAIVAIGTSLVMAWVSVRAGWKTAARMGAGRLTRWTASAISPERRVRAVAMAMCAGVLSLYGIGLVRHRVEALRQLVRHGIMGDNGAANWIGVNEYVRDHTPASATFVALCMNSERTSLTFCGHLRLRTGRSMLFGHVDGFYFDAQKMRWWDEQRARITALAAGWERQDVGEVSRELSLCGAPDYVVAPTARSEWLTGHPDFPYTLETRIEAFTILRKRSSASS